jgi:alpha-galactosidase
VRRETRVLSQFDAVEYRVHFSNRSGRTLSAVSAIKALDLSFDVKSQEGICVISSGGGLADAVLPPRSFTIAQQCFSPTVPESGVVDLTTEGGRSSNKDLPFFLVHNNAREEGVFVAFGWSGQWKASVERDVSKGMLALTGKIPELDIALEPGEDLPGPTILVGFYQGTVADGSNRLRRLIRTAYTPKLAGLEVSPTTTYATWFGIWMTLDDALLRKLADAAATVGQEYFMLDAGWHSSSKENFAEDSGNWYEADRKRFPHGLAPMAEYVRSRNLKFGLWIEPERVAPGSPLAREHPDWVLWAHEKEPESIFSEFNKNYGVLDLGRPEVQRWVRELLDHHIRESGLQYLRLDMNIDPLPYWNAADSARRRGITQLRYVQGLYAVLDWIRERHPEVVLDGCASGGRRIDLEMARRFHTFWISDHTTDPAIVRYHLHGINYFLPGNFANVQYTLPTPDQSHFQPDDMGFQSFFGGAFGTGGRVDRWSPEMRRIANQHIKVHKQIRRYLLEDYYPLSDQPRNLESWSGWQFHDPHDQSGFVQTFRTRAPETTRRFAIYKLEPNARYRLTDAYSGKSFELSGSQAMTQGIEMTQEPMTSKVLTYVKM